MTFARIWLAALLLAVASPALPQDNPSRPQGASSLQAPPLPYRYLGRMIEGGKTIVLLSRGDETFAVRPGQRFGDGKWRLVIATEQELVFVYLPLGTQKAIQL